MIPKERFDEVNDAKKALETQIKDRDKQLKDLEEKAKGNEELSAKIQELQDANKQAKTDYEKQLKDVQLSTAIKLALTNQVHDTDLVAGLVDKTKIELNEDGTIKGGLDDQLKTLKDSKSFYLCLKRKQNQILRVLCRQVILVAVAIQLMLVLISPKC